MGGNPWNSSSLLSVSQVILENLWSAACFGLWFSFLKWNPSSSSKMLHMVEACFYALLFSSFYLDFSLVALHTPSYFLLCDPLSYKCHFPSKTSTSLCLHPLQSLSLKLSSMWSGPKHASIILCFSFFRFSCSYTVACLIASSHLDRYWSYEVTWSTVGLGRTLSLLEDVACIQTINDICNIQWKCALCSFKQKSTYLYGPSRLSSLCLLRSSTYCRS